MTRYWNSRIRNLEPYTSGEQASGFIKLNTNENPYPPSPAVREAIEAYLRDNNFRAARLYPDPACNQLRETIALAYGVDKEEVFCSNGSDEALALAFGAFFEGGPLLFPDVTYSFYPVFAGLWNLPYKKIALNSDWQVELRDYEAAAGAERPAGIIFPNPNAPTSLAVDAASVETLASELEVPLLVDEAYAPFAGEGASLVPFVKTNDHILTFHTLSKAWSLAGMRVGFVIGQRGFIEGLERLRDSFNSYTVDVLAQAAGIAALADRDYTEACIAKVCDTRERISRELRAMGVEVLPSRANFIFMLNREGSPRGAALNAALRGEGILARHFSAARTNDWLRVSIGTGHDMDAFLEALKKINKYEEGNYAHN